MNVGLYLANAKEAERDAMRKPSKQPTRANKRDQLAQEALDQLSTDIDQLGYALAGKWHPTQREYFAAAALKTLDADNFATIEDMVSQAWYVADAAIKRGKQTRALSEKPE